MKISHSLTVSRCVNKMSENSIRFHITFSENSSFCFHPLIVPTIWGRPPRTLFLTLHLSQFLTSSTHTRPAALVSFSCPSIQPPLFRSYSSHFSFNTFITLILTISVSSLLITRPNRLNLFSLSYLVHYHPSKHSHFRYASFFVNS